jgi:hypothetical protein
MDIAKAMIKTGRGLKVVASEGYNEAASTLSKYNRAKCV